MNPGIPYLRGLGVPLYYKDCNGDEIRAFIKKRVFRIKGSEPFVQQSLLSISYQGTYIN